jgi:hypothetical protein
MYLGTKILLLIFCVSYNGPWALRSRTIWQADFIFDSKGSTKVRRLWVNFSSRQLYPHPLFQAGFNPGLPDFSWSKHTKTGKVYQIYPNSTKRP